MHQDHQQRGALRSGQGTPQQSYDRVKLFEEVERLDEIEETRELVTDPKLVEKLFERH